MQNEKIVIVDLTCQPARISVTPVDSLRIETIEAPGHVWRVALRQIDDGQTDDGQAGDGQAGDGQTGDGQAGDGQTGDGQTGDGQTGDGQTGDGQTGDGLITLACDEAMEASDDDRTIVFDDVIYDLPRIEAPDLQAHLMRACWNALYRLLAQRGLLSDRDKAVCFMIFRQAYPTPLLERWREVCAEQRQLKLAGFTHEAAALLIGFLRSEFFAQAQAKLAPGDRVSACLVAAGSDSEVEVIHFDYALESGTRRRLLVHEYFRVTCGDLPARITRCDWLGDLSSIFMLMNSSLDNQSHKALKIFLSALPANADNQRFQVSALPDLKLIGAIYIALCRIGRGDPQSEYVIETACNIGVRINQRKIHPIIRKEDFSRITEFPYTAFRTFKLKGKPGGGFRMNFYCGQSNLIAEATSLGGLSLPQQTSETLSFDKDTVFASAVRLDSPESGEITVGVFPEDKLVGSMPFKIPVIMI